MRKLLGLIDFYKLSLFFLQTLCAIAVIVGLAATYVSVIGAYYQNDFFTPWHPVMWASGVWFAYALSKQLKKMETQNDE